MNRSFIFFILAFLSISCITDKKITKTGIEEIQFGTGGGITGIETIFTLDQNGDVKDKNDSVLHQMSSKDVLTAFEKANQYKRTEYKDPQNLYSFVTIVSKSDTNRIVWGIETTSVPPDLLALHENLMNQTTTTK